MSDDWKQYHPKLALYDVLTKGGGVSVERALQRAESSIEAYRGRANEALEKEVRVLEEIVQARAPNDPDRIYKISKDVLSISNMFQSPMCHAANSLCELVTRMKAAQRWDWPSVGVHVGAMRVLMGKRDDRDPSVVSVLNGLLAIVSRYPDATSPPVQRPAQSA